MTTTYKNNTYISYPSDRAIVYRQKGYWTGINHTNFLKRSCQKFPNKIAVVQGEKTISYQQLFELASKFGSYLKSKGLQKGSTVIFQSPNVIEYFIVLFGIYYIGARPVFCLDGHNAHEIESIAKISGAEGYIRIIEKDSNKKDVIEVTSKFEQPNLKLWFLKTFISESNMVDFTKNIDSTPIIDAENVDAEEIAFFQLSGGTTGMPKLIPRTHDDYLYSVRASAKVAELNEFTNKLIVLPISHNFAMSSPGFLGAIYAGSTIVLAENPSPDTCFKLIEKFQITQVSVVASLIINWLNSTLLRSYDLSSLQVVQIGGSKLLPEVAKRVISELGVTLQQVYGMAEGLVTFTRLDDDQDTIINTQGKPLSLDDEILIMDDQDKSLSIGIEGNILVRGPYTINGYYNSPDINKSSFTVNGFYRTGDIGYIDSNNNIIITGRAKDQINRAGEKIAPSDVENLIITHPLIKDVSIIGVTDKFLGEKIKALIIMNDPNVQLTLSGLRNFLMKKNIATYKLPDEIELVESFKYTKVGKVKK